MKFSMAMSLISVLFMGVAIYLVYLVIQALRIYINKNK